MKSEQRKKTKRAKQADFELMQQRDRKKRFTTNKKKAKKAVWKEKISFLFDGEWVTI